MANPNVKIQTEDFDINAEVERISSISRDIGAIVTFTGVCRDESGKLNALELEHYPGMAETEITRIATNALEQFQLLAVTAIHRYGKIKTGENIVLVIAAARHRQAAFDGANFLMDYLKTNAPFWKKEHLINGNEGEWVSAQDRDNAALDKWESSAKRG